MNNEFSTMIMYHYWIQFDCSVKRNVRFDFEHKHPFDCHRKNNKTCRESMLHREKPFQENLLFKSNNSRIISLIPIDISPFPWLQWTDTRFDFTFDPICAFSELTHEPLLTKEETKGNQSFFCKRHKLILSNELQIRCTIVGRCLHENIIPGLFTIDVFRTS